MSLRHDWREPVSAENCVLVPVTEPVRSDVGEDSSMGVELLLLPAAAVAEVVESTMVYCGRACVCRGVWV